MKSKIAQFHYGNERKPHFAIEISERCTMMVYQEDKHSDHQSCFNVMQTETQNCYYKMEWFLLFYFYEYCK